MHKTDIIMGMPVSIEIIDPEVTDQHFDDLFQFFRDVDEQFSTYKPTSEISQMNAGTQDLSEASDRMQQILAMCDITKFQTNGYFEIERDGYRDPSGLVKGWAIYEAAKLTHAAGFKHFMIEIAGDMQTSGQNPAGKLWQVGIRNPFNADEIVKILAISSEGVATSGTAERGQHIYNPFEPSQTLQDVISLTVVGPNIYEADRFATAAFAMGQRGIEFIENRPELEGYQINRDGEATFTSGFEKYVVGK